ncbi:TPA: hypothetical protein DDY56_01840 [Candidatus Uhrbacteria bacterium]|nr:MAG: hypothetical protein A2317_03750 [Candidatus Uhrbacteria bacterium RIFOXYB2_FULL_41_10]HAL49926.1 hypothetical protein [Candidatus Uhrbacteria bacterium]HAN06168.1 hypothetical protein [Candidatus Uhrbacteria bacterium]HAP65483.1 hypothetical protein [Candidatus Uhrbacteria bacterium]HBA51389.1 hypothetical protein [Candidatus Uhrbacteria bacterium]
MSLLPRFFDDSPAVPGQHPPFQEGPSFPALHRSIRHWNSRDEAFRRVIENLIAIERQLTELGHRVDHNDVAHAYALEHATQVADHTADILAKICAVNNPRKQKIFKAVARATICAPSVMVAMATATDIMQLCAAMPAEAGRRRELQVQAAIKAGFDATSAAIVNF